MPKPDDMTVKRVAAKGTNNEISPYIAKQKPRKRIPLNFNGFQQYVRIDNMWDNYKNASASTSHSGTVSFH